MVYRQQKEAQASLFPVCREGHDSSPQTINRSDVESSQKKIPPHTEAMTNPDGPPGATTSGATVGPRITWLLGCHAVEAHECWTCGSRIEARAKKLWARR